MAINKPKLIALFSKSICVILILCFSSCSLQKRLYTKGFYASKQASAKKLVKADTTTSSSTLSLPIVKEKNKNSTLLTANYTLKNANFLPPLPKLTGGCDTIILRSGAKIIATISEFNPTQIKFKNCDSANEPDMTINKDDVNYVILSNGTKEVFDSRKKYNQSNNSQPNNNLDKIYQPQNTFNNSRDRNIGNKKQNGFSTAGFVLAIISHSIAGIIGIIGALYSVVYSTRFPLSMLAIPFVIAFAAFVFCITAIYQISSDLENQKGLIIAIIGAFLSLLLMVILILFYTGILI
jgi:hypothetical protein